MRRILLGLAGLVVLAGATVAWLATHFDGDKWKALAIEWMRDERQRTLTIDGPVRLVLLPRLQIVVGKLRLSERFRPDDEFLLVDEAVLGVELVPLLASQVVVRRIDARGLRLELERGVDGLSNVGDLAGLTGPGALKLDVMRTVLEDTRVVVRDARWPLDGELRFERLEFGQLGAGGGAPVSLKARLALQQPALAGTLEGRFTLAPGRGDAPTAVDDAQLAFVGTAAGLRELDATWRGSARIDAAHDRLETGASSIELKARGEEWTLEPSTLRLQHFGVQAIGGALAWTGLVFDGQGRIGRDRRFTAGLESPQFGLSSDAVAGRGVKARFAIEGASPLQITLQSGAPTGRPPQLRLPNLRAEVSAGFGSRRIEGSVVGDGLLKLASGTGAFERLSFDRVDVKGVVEPGTGATPWPLAARGSLGLLPDGAQWNLNATLADDSCAAEGSAQAATGAPAPPQLALRLKCERLDLGRWRDAWRDPPAGAAAGSGASGSTNGAAAVPAGRSFPLDGLRAIDGRFSLRANQLRLHPVVARDARLDASLAGGVLTLAGLQARAWDGTIDLSGQADAAEPTREPRFDLRVTATGVDVGGLLVDMTDLRGLRGKGRLTAQLQADGRDPQAWRRTLQGEAGLQLRDGAVVGADLPAALRQAPLSADAAHDEVERAQPAFRTSFTDLKASFDIRDGVARTRELEIRSPLLLVAGEGRVDLGAEQLEFTTQARVVVPSKPREPDDLAMLRGAAVPVELIGPFDAVDWRVRWSALADSEEAGALHERWSAHAAAQAASAASPAAPVQAASGAASAASAALPGTMPGALPGAAPGGTDTTPPDAVEPSTPAAAGPNAATPASAPPSASAPDHR